MIFCFGKPRSVALMMLAVVCFGAAAVVRAAAGDDLVGAYPSWFGAAATIAGALAAAVGVLWRYSISLSASAQKFIENQLSNATKNVEEERVARANTNAAFLTSLERRDATTTELARAVQELAQEIRAMRADKRVQVRARRMKR